MASRPLPRIELMTRLSKGIPVTVVVNNLTIDMDRVMVINGLSLLC